MAIVIGIVIFLTVLGAAAGLVGHRATFGLLRPYLGPLLITVLVASLGVIGGSLFDGLPDFYLITAKIIAVLACSGLCLHLIAIFAKRWLLHLA